MQSLIINFHGLGPQRSGIDAGEANVWCEDIGLYCALLDETQQAAQKHGLRSLITFDDGNRSDRDLALAPLVDRGMEAIFFPCAGRFEDPAFLDKGAVRELVGAGMRIGSHGWSHIDWRSAAPEVLQREVIEAKDRIEQVAGTSITSVAIPFGSYDRRILRRARVFDTIYTSDAAIAHSSARIQPRFSYTKSWSSGSVERLIVNSRRPARVLRQRFAMTIKRLR